MRKFYLKERDALEQKNAGSKARNDVESIAESIGYEPLDVALPFEEHKSLAASVKANLEIEAFFKKRLSGLQEGDELLVQFPPCSHSVLFPRLYRSLRKKGVHVTFLIHDLERMRYSQLNDVPLKKRVRISLEETRLLKEADRIICHNDKMKAFLVEQGFSSHALIPLGLFDYLTDCPMRSMEDKKAYNKVIIAGNLRPKKVGYAYNLPTNCDFNLYGVDYGGRLHGSSKYFGAFPSDKSVAVIVAEPTPFAVIVPFFTVATPPSLVSHLSSFPAVAFSGVYFI